MNLIIEAYGRLFPEKVFLYETRIEYNRRLAPFNANIKLRREVISLCMNLQWKDIDDEIKIGLVQSLLLKILKDKEGIKQTMNINLYNNFIRNIPILTPKTVTDEMLEKVFLELNERFFENGLEKPNLKWGEKAFRRLAHYNYHSDTITISETFREAPTEILQYIMYHEMLHKKMAFTHKEGRHSYHSPEFKRAEGLFPRSEQIERDITLFVRKQERREKGKKINENGRMKKLSWQSIFDYF
jgi:hypothetical protein